MHWKAPFLHCNRANGNALLCDSSGGSCEPPCPILTPLADTAQHKLQAAKAVAHPLGIFLAKEGIQLWP